MSVMMVLLEIGVCPYCGWLGDGSPSSYPDSDGVAYPLLVSKTTVEVVLHPSIFPKELLPDDSDPDRMLISRLSATESN